MHSAVLVWNTERYLKRTIELIYLIDIYHTVIYHIKGRHEILAETYGIILKGY